MKEYSAPPDGLPIYRLISGPDDAKFCFRVSEMLALGYLLHGAPAATFNGESVVVCQAIVWPTAVHSQIPDHMAQRAQGAAE